MIDGRWYTTEQLARLLHVDASTVRRWRTLEPFYGPAFVRVSDRVVVYAAADVEAWLWSRRTDPGEMAA
ncbi:helix-turn-helix transcriptional regulator [Actinokineospora pegani]|uniref:helix-turn-helix transcriptional regulator n=1 Tax=Actinokineospora pegani TaxID=2654637 RepID=UPI001F34F3EB|nr:helix-turn-helix domain-containing protein [Actinokineospora pegani]